MYVMDPLILCGNVQSVALNKYSISFWLLGCKVNGILIDSPDEWFNFFNENFLIKN